MAKLRSGLKYFMTRIIDYAGMFPPAKLPFTEAFSNYLNYQNDSDSWMMERFVFPITKHNEIASFQKELSTHKKTINLSILPQYSDSEVVFLENFRNDFELLNQATKDSPAKFDLNFFEFKLPKNLLEADQNHVYPFFDELLSIAKIHPMQKSQFFIEMTIGSDWKYSMNRFTNLLTLLSSGKTLRF